MKLNLRAKLVGGYVVILLLMAVVGLEGICTSKIIKSRLENIVRQDVKAASILGVVARRFAFIRSDFLLHVLQSSIDDMNRYESENADREGKINRDLDTLENIIKDQSTLNKLAEFRVGWDTYLRTWKEQVIPLSRANRDEEAFELARKRGVAGTAAREAMYKLDELYDVIDATADDSLKLSEQIFRKSQIILLAVIILAIILGLALGIRQSSLIAGPVNAVSKAAQLVAAGELNHRVTVKTGDEIESMADSFNKMTSNMNKMVEELQLEATEHKQAEEKIEEYSENLEHMVEERTKELDRALYDTEEARDKIDGILKSVADGLIVTDIYHRIILMNRAAEDLLNVRFSKVIDRPIDVAIQDKTLRDWIKSTLEKRKTDYQFDFELPGENAKHPRIIRARTSGIKDKAGTYTGIIIIIHDVTLEREVDRMKTEFISTAAHEFRTPLTSIQGFSEILLMREDLKPEEKKKFLTHINNQSVSLANIINDLLDISRIESGLGFSLNKVPCNMADIIRGLVLQFQEQTSKHYFEVILPEEPVKMYVDKEKMEQVLQNLFSNAVKYSPEGGTICLSAKKISDSAIEISVADQGIGMTPEQVEKIFDKFYRADASDTAIPGTGLGMSIVKYIVEAHGGKVWVESEPGKGTTVTFTMPT